MLFFFKKGGNAAKTGKDLCEVYGDNAIGESTVRWLVWYESYMNLAGSFTSPAIASSDYHLFLSLQNSLQGKSFIDLEDVKKHIENFFSSKPAKFYADSIF